MDNDGAGNDPGPPPSHEETPIAEAPAGDVGTSGGPLSEKDSRMFGMLAHILGAVTSFVGPLVIWLIKKDESPFVNDQGKEALNFQITILIGYVVAGIVSVIPFIGCVGMLLMPALGIVGLIFGILGGLEANKGVAYRYPFALRLVS